MIFSRVSHSVKVNIDDVESPVYCFLYEFDGRFVRDDIETLLVLLRQHLIGNVLCRYLVILIENGLSFEYLDSLVEKLSVGF